MKLFMWPAVCALAGFFVFVSHAVVQLTPPVPFDINGSFAPAGASLSGQTVVSFAGGIYSFSYSEGGNTLAQYELNTTDPDVQKGLLKIKEAVTNSFPMAQAGPSYRKLDGTVLTPRQFIDQLDVPGGAAGATFEHQQFGNAVSFLITHTLGGIETKLRYDFELKSKTLVIRASAVNPRTNPLGNYQGFILGPTENTPNPRPVAIPYMDLTPLIVFGTGSNQFFSSVYIDFTRSNSNTEPRKAGPSLISPSSYLSSYYTEYIPGESNVYPSFGETAYITVSGDVRDAFVKIHRSASAYRQTLTDRMVLDIWGDTYMWSLPGDPQVFPKIKVLMDISNLFRMDKLLFIAHVWQRFGYDCGLPNHVPANTTIPYLGTQAIPIVSAAAASYGYLFALHENYVDMYPNSTYWNPSSVAREPNGSFRRAWNNPGCTEPPPANPAYPPPQSFRIATDKMVSFASQESPQIKNIYRTTAAYLDVSTTMPFNVLVDYSGTNPNASTIRQGFQNNLALNEYVRSVHQGPLLGEGAWADWQTATYQAGSVDGVEREISGRESASIMPDFELREVKPLMANHGMGYPGRWVGDGTSPWVDPNLFFNQKSDKYRAMEIAYGHAGFITDSTLGGLSLGTFTKHLMREYHLLRSLQSQYLGSDIAQVLYRNAGGNFVDLSQAVKENLNFQQAQIYEEYANGLKLYVNFHPSQNWTVTLDGQAYILPPYGWVARNANINYVNYSALTDGHRVDYVRSNEYIFADARGVSTVFNGYSGTFTTDAMRTVRPDGWAMMVDANGVASLFDAIAPTVSVTAPLANAIVSGATTVTATASDNVGVAGVQFLLDSQNLGVEDTTAPYEVSWDTTAAVNGAHTLSARARDDAGNNATSPGVPVTVNNSQSTRPAAPTGLTATAASQTQINLNWTDNATNETGYRVERAGSASGPFTAITGPNHLAANTVAFNDTGLSANTTYYYRVVAFNVAGDSDPSGTVNATTQSPSPGFNFSVGTGGDRSVTQGSSVTNTVTAVLTSGSGQSVAFSASGLPAGATASFAPTACVPTCSSTLTISTSATTPAGSSNITVTGTAGTITRTANFDLTVLSVRFRANDRVQTTATLNVRATPSLAGILLGTQAPGALGTVVGSSVFADGYSWWQIDYDSAPDGWSVEDYLAAAPPPQPTLTLTATPASITQGQASTLAWASTNATACTASGAWSGAKAVSGSEPVTPAATANYTLECTGPGGSISRMATVTVTAPPPGFNFSVGTGGDRSVTQGSSVTNTVTAVLTSGSGQSVAFSATGLPAGATASFAPTACVPTCSSTLTITAGATTPTEASTITVTGTAGTVTRSAQFVLTVNASRPNAPSGLTASAASPTSIRLAWTDTATNETGFKVERASSAGGPFAAITTAPSHLAANTTSYTDTNASSVTTYYYRVVAFNAAGDSAPSNTANATTPQMPDTQAPAVSLTAPAANAVVAATITVRANATDNVGVLGVQFLLDGGNLGLEDTAAPYEIQWDTLAATNGSHTLSARARDAAGNIGNAQGVAVIVRNLPNAPTTLAASAISTSQINLAWSDNATNETGYAVERGTDGVNFSTIAGNLSPNTTSYPDTGLAAATRYYYRARAFNTGGDSGYSNVANATTQAAPPPPFNFSLATAGNRSVTQGSAAANPITVSLVSGTGQSVALSASGLPTGASASFAPAACAPSCQSTLTVATSATTPLGNHQITVTGTAGSIIQTTSFILSVTVPPPTRPVAPTGLTATAASPTQVNLAWTNVATNATGIRVQGSAVSATGPFATLPNGSNLAPNTVGFSNINLTANTRYWYRVIAWNAAGDSDASNAATVLTPQTPDTQTPTVTLTSPAAQAAVSATVAVRASASDNVGVAGVQFLLNGQNLEAEDTVAPYEVQWDTAAAANGTHRLSARARDGAGNTRVAADVLVTVSNAALRPNPPTDLAAAVLSGREIRLTWADNAANETRYEIERSASPAPYQVLVNVITPNVTSYTDRNLTPNTLYFYRVRAWNGAVASNYSNEVFARTLPEDVPSTPTPTPTSTSTPQPGLSAPSNFRITARTPTRADFSWTDNATSEQGFKLEHSYDGATFREVATLPANYGAYAYAGLTPGSLNYYRLRAFSGNRYSPYSSVVTVRMPATTPPAGMFIEELRFGSRHAQVKLLQELLIREGVYPEAIVSGYFGLLTQNAVVRFQGKYGLTQALRGVVDAATRTKLNERYGALPSPTPTPQPGGRLTKNFGSGDRDPEIKLLQQWLNRDAATRVAASGAGSPGSETDYYGGLTTTAVQRFQRKQGIVSSGIPSTTGYGRVGPRTRAELNRIYGAP